MQYKVAMRKLPNSLLLFIIVLGSVYPNFASSSERTFNRYSLADKIIWSDFDYGGHEERISWPGSMATFVKEGDLTSVIIFIEGEIPRWSIADKFRAATTGKSNVVVVLNSNGGNSEQAEKIAGHIRAIGMPRGLLRKRTRVTTSVLALDQSHSAATIIFLAGQERLVDPTAEIGVHAVSREASATPASELAEWIKFGLPQTLAQKIFIEGFFNPGATARTLSLDEIRMFDIASLRTFHTFTLSRCESLFGSVASSASD